MLQRCLDPGADGYRHYGGRGIAVCARWQTFEHFLADMGPAPAGMSIDRIDNDGDYEPGNCRWATPTEQARNSRHCLAINVGGVVKPLSVWCEERSLPYFRVHGRLRRGWSPKRALELI